MKRAGSGRVNSDPAAREKAIEHLEPELQEQFKDLLTTFDVIANSLSDLRPTNAPSAYCIELNDCAPINKKSQRKVRKMHPDVKAQLRE